MTKKDNEIIIYQNIKKKLGYRYAGKIAKHLNGITSGEIYEVFRGKSREYEKIEKIIAAAAIAISEENATKRNIKNLKQRIISKPDVKCPI